MRSRAVATTDSALRLIETDPDGFDVLWIRYELPGIGCEAFLEKVSEQASESEMAFVLLPQTVRIDEARRLCGGKVQCIAKPARQRKLLEASFKAIAGKPARPVKVSPSVAEKRRDPSDVDEQVLSEDGLKLLITDDNAVNVKVAMHMLKRLGYGRVDTATNGKEALDALGRSSYDVILMDVQMPVMDGLEATRRIREDFPADRQPKIIALTAGVSQEDKGRCNEAGMDGFVSKPVKIESLRSALEDAVSCGDFGRN